MKIQNIKHATTIICKTEKERFNVLSILTRKGFEVQDAEDTFKHKPNVTMLVHNEWCFTTYYSEDDTIQASNFITSNP